MIWRTLRNFIASFFSAFGSSAENYFHQHYNLLEIFTNITIILRVIEDGVQSFFFYKNIFHKNIEAEICE